MIKDNANRYSSANDKKLAGMSRKFKSSGKKKSHDSMVTAIQKVSKKKKRKSMTQIKET